MEWNKKKKVAYKTKAEDYLISLMNPNLIPPSVYWTKCLSNV